MLLSFSIKFTVKTAAARGWLTGLQASSWFCCSFRCLRFDWRCHHCQRLGLAGWHCACWIERAWQGSQGAGCRGVRVVHGHTADDVGALAQPQTEGRECRFICHIREQVHQDSPSYSAAHYFKVTLPLRMCVAAVLFIFLKREISEEHLRKKTLRCWVQEYPVLTWQDGICAHPRCLCRCESWWCWLLGSVCPRSRLAVTALHWSWLESHHYWLMMQ